MIIFEKDRLIIEVMTDTPVDTYFDLLESVMEIAWFALDNSDAQDIIRKETALLAYYLGRPLTHMSRENRNRLQPKR